MVFLKRESSTCHQQTVKLNGWGNDFVNQDLDSLFSLIKITRKKLYGNIISDVFQIIQCSWDKNAENISYTFINSLHHWLHRFRTSAVKSRVWRVLFGLFVQRFHPFIRTIDKPLFIRASIDLHNKFFHFYQTFSPIQQSI